MIVGIVLIAIAGLALHSEIAEGVHEDGSAITSKQTISIPCIRSVAVLPRLGRTGQTRPRNVMRDFE